LAAATYLEDNTEKLPAEFAQDVEIIKRNVQLQARLIDDLLDLTRIARGKLHLELEDCDAHTVIRNALETAHSAIAAKKLKLQIEFEAKDCCIHADCIRLQQVFWNLINNAVKFTPEGGDITICTSNNKEGRFHFQITDTGIGIEPRRLSSLFQPFEQADSSVTRQFGGLGLGLAISKRILELHHGTIQAESPGRSLGATFKVTLDVLPAAEKRNNNESERGKKIFKPLRILLVEDHQDTRHALSRLLTHFGHNVVTAKDVASANEVMASVQIDLLLCDIGLPDGSGYDVAAHARTKGAIKAVALTGFGTESDVRRSKEAGFDFHLVKPVNFQELQTVLDRLAA
jgi:CheY-like chemotaxis protein